MWGTKHRHHETMRRVATQWRRPLSSNTRPMVLPRLIGPTEKSLRLANQTRRNKTVMVTLPRVKFTENDDGE